MNLEKKITWWGIGALGLLLLLSSIPGFAGDMRQADLMRLLAQVGGAQWGDEIDNPLLCTRSQLSNPLPKAEVSIALATLPLAPDRDSFRLTAAANCLLGQSGAALAAYQSSSISDLNSALQQYTILAEDGNPAEGIQILAAAGLSDDEWLLAADVMTNPTTSADPRPILRSLLEKEPADQMVWMLWLKEGSRLQQSAGWAAALAWYQEGLQHPDAMTGSLALQAGRILQKVADPLDPHAALTFYNQAIASGKYLNKEESTAYIFRGEVYRSLSKEYSPSQSLAEFDRALEIKPDADSAWFSKGLVYFYDLKDLTNAELNFRHALLLNVKSPEAHYFLGEVARTRGDLARAKNEYEQALTLKPDWQAPQDRMNSLLAGK
jgi:tetratricopeptide (TPR) repeat protein